MEKINVGWVGLGGRGYGLLGMVLDTMPTSRSSEYATNTRTGLKTEESS